MKCKNCQIELEPSKGKKPRVFCSDRCTKAYNRKLTKGLIETDKQETDTIGQVETDTEEFVKKYGEFCSSDGARVVGRCRWCGKKITPEEYGQKNWHLVECCYGCVAKRNA